MSHFPVAVHVPANNENMLKYEGYLEQVLMPWHEYESTGIINEYVQHIPVTEITVNDYLEEKSVFAKIREEDLESAFDPNHPVSPEKHVIVAPNGYRRTNCRSCYFENFLDFAHEKYGIDLVINDKNEAPETGSYIYMMPDAFMGPFKETIAPEEIRQMLIETIEIYQYTNPNSKWDWWTVGGRYSLTDKDNRPCSMCQVKNLRLITQDVREPAEKIWHYIMEDEREDFDKEETDFLLEYGLGYDRKRLSRFPSMEAFVEDYCKWRPYAYVKDGVWHEAGQMGWFGCADIRPEAEEAYNKEFDTMIAECNPEDWFVCVDCHI